jgi:hypothetical protein
MGARHAAAAPKELVGSRATSKAAAARRKASTGFGQEARAWPATRCLAQGHLAGRYGGAISLTICPSAGSGRASGLLARRDRPEEWLLIEWPEGEEAPTKYWFSTLPANIAWRQLVDTAKLRWRIERDYHELKQEVGLGHFEGRGWRGFHHHATLCIAAYGFLLSERETIPPSAAGSARLFEEITLPKTYRPRGCAIAA